MVRYASKMDLGVRKNGSAVKSPSSSIMRPGVQTDPSTPVTSPAPNVAERSSTPVTKRPSTPRTSPAPLEQFRVQHPC